MARYGGMEQHVCLLAALLAGNGHAVTVLTTSNSLNQDARAELIKAGIELRELAIERGAASKMRKLGWLLLQALRLRSCQWDVVYTNGQSALSRLVWLAKGKGCRIIHHHHTGGDCGEQLTWNKSFRRMLVRVPELVACSETTRRHLEAVLKRTDITYLPYLTIESVTINQVLERKYLDKATLNFGFIGRLVSSKGIETLCALSQEPALAQVQWHVHGSGEHYPQSFFDRYPNVRYTVHFRAHPTVQLS